MAILGKGGFNEAEPAAQAICKLRAGMVTALPSFIVMAGLTGGLVLRFSTWARVAAAICEHVSEAQI